MNDLRALVQAFVDTVSAASRAQESRGRGGQQVPFHGDFCSAPPGTMTRLEWWARQFSKALADQ